jgi:hypothetical protein
LLVLAVAAFSFIGFSLTVTTSDTVVAELKKCYSDGISVVVLKPNSEKYSSYKGEYLEVRAFTDTQIATYEEITGDKVISVMLRNESIYNPDQFVNSPANYYDISDQLSDTTSAYDYLLCRSFDGVSEIYADTTENDLCITPDPRLSATTECRLPSNIYEIAITDLKADFYMQYGYLTDGGETLEIDKPDDLIGKSLDGLTIVGVYSTAEDTEDLKQITRGAYGERKFSYYIDGYHIANFAFVYNGYQSNSSTYNNSSIYNIYYKLSGDISIDKSLIGKMTYKVPYDNSKLKMNTYSACIRSLYSGFNNAAQNYLAEEVIWVAYVVVGIFTLMSLLLTVNFLLVGHEERKREFGELGVKTSDIVAICLSEGLIIAFIEFVVSLIAVGIISAILNSYFFIPVFFMGVIPILSVFLLSFGVTALGVVFSFVKLLRKKPVDGINEAKRK